MYSTISLGDSSLVSIDFFLPNPIPICGPSYVISKAYLSLRLLNWFGLIVSSKLCIVLLHRGHFLKISCPAINSSKQSLHKTWWLHGFIV